VVAAEEQIPRLVEQEEVVSENLLVLLQEVIHDLH
tara:strand:+ start:50 stop:154 length:105 start_codon:yes stop_codon:yes gene_type:complete